MTPNSPSRKGAGVRRLGAVPWDHDGCQGLTIWAGEDVPNFDDPVIRGALARSAHMSERIDALGRALNRNLWPLGYAATIAASRREGSTVDVLVVGSR
jgi:hypothetical protein